MVDSSKCLVSYVLYKDNTLYKVPQRKDSSNFNHLDVIQGQSASSNPHPLVNGNRIESDTINRGVVVYDNVKNVTLTYL